MTFSVSQLQQTNAKRWAVAKLTRASEYKLPITRALAARPRYESIQAATGVHWVFIAVTHYRECSQNFSQSLAQGDPWDKRSIHVPAGRGPFQSFEAAATDALVNCAPYAAHNHDWSLPNVLTLLESYNGLGYARKGVPSAYVWSGTDQYVSGKYVSDGVYDPKTVDKQLGVAGFVICLIQADPSIALSMKDNRVQVIPQKAPSTPEKPVGAVILPAPHPTASLPDKAPEGVLQEVWDWIKNH